MYPRPRVVAVEGFMSTSATEFVFEVLLGEAQLEL